MTILREWRKRHSMSPPTMDDMKAIDKTLAAVIYKEMFADPIRFDDIPSGLNYRILDISISAGYPTGVLTILSNALGIKAQFDNKTIAAIKAADPAKLVPALGEAWLAFKIAQAEGSTKYFKGWNNRKVRANARALAMTKPAPAPVAAPTKQEAKMSGWRVAKSLETLLADVNKFAPHRRKDSDGSIGDARHQAERTSDHNPYITVNGVGVVRARDFTHAPETGFDAYAFAEMLRLNKDDRIRYIISNKKIASGAGGPAPWQWRPYNGSNPHDHHTHVSVSEAVARFDDPHEWDFKGMGAAIEQQAPVANSYVAPPTTLRLGSRGDLVKKMQTGIKTTTDGFFGPETEKALKAFQAAHKLTADGICGPGTWKVINTAA